jgi:hypothetical protein
MYIEFTVLSCTVLIAQRYEKVFIINKSKVCLKTYFTHAYKVPIQDNFPQPLPK